MPPGALRISRWPPRQPPWVRTILVEVPGVRDAIQDMGAFLFYLPPIRPTSMGHGQGIWRL